MLLFSRIEGPLLDEYWYFEEGDRCLFLREYTAKAGYQESDTNQLIFNLKKDMARRQNPWEWRWKTRAIETCAAELSAALAQSKSALTFTFVPVPPSKSVTDPEHDDRLLQILRKVDLNGGGLDVRELVVQTQSRDAAHVSQSRRPKPEDHLRNWRINEDAANPPPSKIVVFDDVLTTGSSFRAMQTILSERFPEVQIVGMFIARTLHGEPDYGS